MANEPDEVGSLRLPNFFLHEQNMVLGEDRRGSVQHVDANFTRGVFLWPELIFLYFAFSAVIFQIYLLIVEGLWRLFLGGLNQFFIPLLRNCLHTILFFIIIFETWNALIP